MCKMSSSICPNRLQLHTQVSFNNFTYFLLAHYLLLCPQRRACHLIGFVLWKCLLHVVGLGRPKHKHICSSWLWRINPMTSTIAYKANAFDPFIVIYILYLAFDATRLQNAIRTTNERFDNWKNVANRWNLWSHTCIVYSSRSRSFFSWYLDDGRG